MDLLGWISFVAGTILVIVIIAIDQNKQEKRMERDIQTCRHLNQMSLENAARFNNEMELRMQLRFKEWNEKRCKPVRKIEHKKINEKE